MSNGGGFTAASTSGINFPNELPKDADGQPQYVVVEYKICELCDHRFMRQQTPLRKLHNGRVIDPNRMCPTCEHKMAKSAVQHGQEMQHLLHDKDYASFPRGDIPGEEQQRQRVEARARKSEDRTIELMERECLRKQAYTDPKLAMKIAKRSRKRSEAPVSAYKCKAHIDPLLLRENPDLFAERSAPHWHVGSNNDGVLKRKFEASRRG